MKKVSQNPQIEDAQTKDMRFCLSKKELKKIKTNAVLSVLVIALGHIIESIDKFI